MTSIALLHMGCAPENPSGCEIYRGHMPMWHLRQNGLNASWFYFEDLWQQAQRDQTTWARLMAYDLFVFPRMYVNNDIALHGVSELLSTLRQAGKKIVYEVDDDLTNMDRKVIDGDAIAVAKQADAVTVTTPHLRKIMQKAVGKPVYVLPNALDPQLWQSEVIPLKAPEGLKIGLTGSATHEQDWAVLSSVIPRIRQEFPDVQLIVGGFLPDYISNEDVTYVPPLPYPQYAHLIKNLDVVLAPINNDRFNMGKSPIKAVEGMGAHRLLHGKPAGAAVLASDHPVYRLAIRQRENGLLVEYTEEAWYTALKEIICDNDLRHRLQREGYIWAWANHDMSKTWTKWAKAYRKIMSNKRRKTA